MKKQTKPKIPVVTETEQRTIGQFLEHFTEVFDANVKKTKAQMARLRDDTLKGQLTYWKDCEKCLRWLIAMNNQRKVKKDSTRAKAVTNSPRRSAKRSG